MCKKLNRDSVAVTGASGHLGNVIVRKLLKQGIPVRALIHKDVQALEGLNVVRIHGDIQNIDTLRTLCKGCKTLYHCAAHISIVSYEKRKLHDVNVKGTQNVIKVALENDMKLAYISSVEAVGKQHEGVHTEEDGFSPKDTLIDYGKSKALAALDVITATQSENLNAVILCPAGIAGPFEFGTSKVGRMVRDFVSKKLPAGIKKGGFCFVDVRDVANAAIAAVDRGTRGSHYIVSSEYMENNALLRIMSEHTNIPMPKFYISTRILKYIAPFIELWGLVSMKEPLFSSGVARILESRLNITSIRLESELGIRPRPLAQSLIDQIAWYEGKPVQL